MKLVGTFTEEQCKNGDDRKACDKITQESGGRLKYIKTEFVKRKGRTEMKVWLMDVNEYARSKDV